MGWTIVAVLLSMLCSYLPAWGQGFHHRKGWGGPPWLMEDRVRQLNLNEEQVAQIRELRESLWKETLPLRDALMMKRFRLRDLLMDPQADPNQILAIQREVSELEGRLQERITIFQLAVRRILTADQIKLLPPGFGLESFQRPGMRPGRFRGMGPP